MNRTMCVILAVLAAVGMLAMGPTGNGAYVALALVLIATSTRLVHLVESGQR